VICKGEKMNVEARGKIFHFKRRWIGL
jgi:hypothetical protein